MLSWAGDITQWLSDCLADTRLWVETPESQRKGTEERGSLPPHTHTHSGTEQRTRPTKYKGARRE